MSANVELEVDEEDTVDDLSGVDSAPTGESLKVCPRGLVVDVDVASLGEVEEVGDDVVVGVVAEEMVVDVGETEVDSTAVVVVEGVKDV
uniref:Uncharacterized protein n=1 Tax=Panagrolaimus davidi TaxID=227884 RepID=A0A914QPY0_9BILA